MRGSWRIPSTQIMSEHPSHPKSAAALLMIGVVAFIVLMAYLGPTNR